jgi:chromosome segregation ATPase
VTFETLFTGLERQVTNVTAQINRGKNAIQVLDKQNLQIEAKIDQLRSIDLSAETKDLDTQIQKNRSLEEQQINAAKQDHENKLVTLNNQIDTINKQLTKIETEQNQRYQVKVDAIQDSLDRLNEQINERTETIGQLRQDVQNLSGNGVQDDLIKVYETKISQIQAKIQEVERWLNSNEGEQIKKAQREIGVVDDGKVGGNTRRNFDAWKASNDQEINAFQTKIQNRLSTISGASDQQKKSLNDEILKLSVEIETLDAKRADKEQELQNAKIVDNNASNPSISVSTKTDRIAQIRKDIDQLNQQHNVDLEKIRSDRQALQQNYEVAKQQIESKNLEARTSIPKLEEEVAVNKAKILNLEEELTEKAQQNQIYRFAQKRGGYEDILRVEEKDLTFISIIWFGSIALVCATVGTILALISNIMTDPDAFVIKQQSRLNNKLARSFRRLFLSLRKRVLLQRKLVKVEVPVEIEKIVEVEKIVEKIVEKPIRQEVDKLVPEIIPIPVFVPNGGDATAEVQKVADHYADLNKKVKDTFNQTARKHEDYEPKEIT